jgi:hypothetical protein
MADDAFCDRKMNRDSVRHLTIAPMLCQLWARGDNSTVMIKIEGCVAKNHLGHKNTEHHFSSGGNLEEIGNESNLSANVAFIVWPVESTAR